MLLQHRASVKYGYSTPLGEYLVFFNESFPLQSPVDGAVRAKWYSQLMQLPLDGGNPLAQQPQYDLAGLIAKQKLDELPMANFSQPRPNTKFAGNNARLPFTERYKYLLYVVVTMVIAGLIFVQYRIFRRVEQ
jgi:hypothetical protein